MPKNPSRIANGKRKTKREAQPFMAFLAAGITLAMATLVGASSSPQVEELNPLAVPRTAHVATALADGRVLITGGRDASGTILSAAEIFDPATKTSTAVTSLGAPRVGHTATVLKDGRVLVAGGSDANGPLASAEIFDPASPVTGFRPLSTPMGASRSGHTATLLNSGKVLIAGGDDAGTAEVFDPIGETFSSTLLTMTAPRVGHTATLFSDDSVLLAGGNTDSMEYFSSVNQTFTLDPQKMTAARTGHEAISLSDTRLLFFGGDTNHTVDEFNPTADTLTLKATMDAPASSATLLANGKVLVLRPDVAGIYAPDAVDQTTAFAPFDEVSVPGSTGLLRQGQTATELSGDRKILVAGGENAQHQPVLQIAAFNPARIWTDKDDYMPTEPVLLFGSGWRANEDVYLYAVDSETEQWTYGSTATADAQGSFAVEPYFIVQMRQLGTTFEVSAVGAQSNMQAEVSFTDGGNFSYTPPSQPLTISTGNNSSFTQNVTDPKNNAALTASPSVTGTSVAGTSPLPVSWVSTTPTSLPFAATGSNDVTQSWSVKVTVPSNTTPGIYSGNIKAHATGSGAMPNDGQGTDMTITVPSGPAAKLALSGSNADLASGSTRTFTATIQDANGNTVFTGPDSTLSVTFAKTSGTGTVTGLGSVNAVAGVATLTVTGNQVGSITIAATASTGALAAATGNPTTFNVVAGAASKLALSGSTTDLAGGNTRTLTATIQDANGNTVTSGPNSSLSVTFAKTAGTGTVSGLGSSTASGGAATLTVTGNQTGSITIGASAAGLTAGNGNPVTFNVVAGAASKLALSGSTANLTAGTTRVLTATIQDSVGNTITTGTESTLSVTFAKTAGAGNVSGLNSVNAVAGVASLTVTGTTAGSVTITASGGALTAGTGNPITFTVVANTTVDHFAFATISSPQTAGTPFNITITAQDAGNNTVIGYSGNGFKVKLTSTGTIAGGTITTPAFTNGVLANQSVTITNTGNFTITATDNSGGTTATGTSNPFQVNAGAASKLAFSQQPATTGAGQTMAAISVQIQDANGNLVNSTVSVAMAIGTNPSSGTLSGTTPVAAVNGTATFSDLSINKGGVGYTLQASSAGLTSATSTAFTINNPAPTLASIAPTSGNLSDTLDVVFTGTNYISGVTTVSFGANITVNTVTVNSSIKLTANITIQPGATVGPRNVSVTNPAPGGGTATLTNGFTVNNPATTTTVTSSANPSTYGDSVTFTATVSSAAATPTGSVNFVIDGGSPVAGTAGTTTATTATWTYTTSALNVAGSPHSISASFTHTGSFADSSGSLTGGQTVNKAHLTVTADDKSKTYDGHIFTAFTSKITGFVNGETTSVLSGAAAYTGDATSAINAGSYTITPTVGTLTATNYDFTVFNNGTLTIDKADATWTTNPNSKTYGDNDPNPLTTGSGTGFAATDNVTATYSRTSGETVAGGPYHITATLSPASVLTNYNITNAGASFTINTRPATWTTNPNSKTYGDNDPNPLTTGSGSGFLAADNVTAAYSRAAGETVAGGPYHITATLSPAAVLSNYDITNAGASFTINTRSATWTTSPNSKTYGDNDPNPLTIGSGSGFLAADNVTATYTRAAGESVLGGPYHITATLSPAAVLSNYDITNAGANFTINARPATWTTNPNSKTYGDTDPNPLTTGSGSGFLAADNVTATYSRVGGETVGGSPYHITATLSANAALTNYNITNAGADFTINKKDATWTTNPNSKTYGEGDPTPLTTGNGSGFLFSDNVTASYSRDAGETVAGSPYHIAATLSPSAVLSNYNITNAGASFTIHARPATWTTNPNSKTYGDNDPNPLTTGSGDFLAADNVTATYGRATGETVVGGPYHITATLNAAAGVLANYIITNTGADFTINARPATWTTNPNSKIYGDNDPNPLTTGSGDFLAADNVTATYSRAAGETVAGSPYHIAATLNAAVGVLANYIITNTGADFTINARPATWTTNPNSKIYGEADPNPLTSGSGNFLAADNVTATYSRATGETVVGGPYHITATLNAAAGVLANYIITNTGASFTINARPAIWTTNPNSKTYGDLDPTPLTMGSAVAPGPGTGFLVADNVTATYSRAMGETVLGGPYHITANLGPAGVLSNYSITNNGASFTINTRPATWTTNNNSKVYGETDPNPLTSGNGSNFVAADNVTATYTRATGETVLGGPYHITANLGPAGVLSNYSITNTGASFTINTRPATWTTNANSKTYGMMDPSPVTTGSAVAQGPGTGFLAADGVTATYSRAAGENASPPTYHITATLTPTGVLSNYSVTNAGAEFTINKAHLTVTAADKTKVFDNTPYSPFTATVSGFVNGETDSGLRSAGALSGAAAFTGDAISAYLPGTYTITPTIGTLAATNYDFTPFTNGKLSITYGTCSGSVPGILPPINSDGSSVYSRKGGSTIPVKFRVCDANGNPISNPAAVFAGTGGTITMLSAVRGTVDSVNETTTGDIPDVAFRYSDGQWIFNMATTNLTAGSTYTFKINLAYAPASIVFKVGVK